MTAKRLTDETEPPEAPFQRPMPVARLPRDRETRFRVAAEPAELAALAEYLDVVRIDRLTFAGFISPEGQDGWRIRGRMVASVDQACVVTLAPLHFRHDAEIERDYLPEERMTEVVEIRILHDEADPPDPYGDTLDPAQLALETLLLMIDPYPRAEGAELPASPPGADIESDRTKPFAALAAWKTRAEKEGK